MDVDIEPPEALSEADWALWRALHARERAVCGPYFSPGWVRRVQAVRGDVRVAVLHTRGRATGFFAVQGFGRRVLSPAGGAVCDLQGVVGEAPTLGHLAAMVREAGAARLDLTHALADQPGLAGAVRAPHVGWVVDLEAPFDAYAAQRKVAGSKVAKRIAKRQRAVEAAFGPVALQTLTGDRAVLDLLLAWKRDQYARTGQRDVLASGWVRALIDACVTEEEPDFGAVVYALVAGDRPLAATLCLRSAHAVHAWFTAYDPQAERVSPGFTLFGLMIRELTGGGFAELDFGAGDYRFKREFATRTRALGAGFVGASPVSSSTRALLFRARGAAERSPLGRASAWPGKAMRRLDLNRGLQGPVTPRR